MAMLSTRDRLMGVKYTNAGTNYHLHVLRRLHAFPRARVPRVSIHLQGAPLVQRCSAAGGAVTGFVQGQPGPCRAFVWRNRRSLEQLHPNLRGRAFEGADSRVRREEGTDVASFPGAFGTLA